jgi:glucose-6-phosphate 1-dehydrogenase
MSDGSTSIIIFGATGDLTSRKLIPSLFSLYRRDKLPPNWRIIGYARRPWDDQVFRDTLREWVEKASDFDADAWAKFCEGLHYIQGDLATPED